MVSVLLANTAFTDTPIVGVRAGKAVGSTRLDPQSHINPQLHINPQSYVDLHSHVNLHSLIGFANHSQFTNDRH